MNTETIEDLWRRLKAWCEVEFPEALQNLNDPATPDDIAQLEAETGIALPDDYRQFLQINNGIKADYEPSPFAWPFAPLSADSSLQQYQLMQEISAEFPSDEDFLAWYALIADGIGFARGNVKLLTHSPKWLPIADFNGDVTHYLDFDPAPGGDVGQIIVVDPEDVSWAVRAPTFSEFLHDQVEALETGRIRLTDDGFLEDDNVESQSQWPMPDYLKSIKIP